MEHTNHSLQVRDQASAEKIEEQRIEIERLKAERRMLHDGEQKERQVGEERERDFYDERRQYNDEISHLRHKNETLTNEFETLKTQYNILTGQHSTFTRNASSEISLLNSRIEELERERDGLKGWERRARGLSIELEEEKRRNEERRERGELEQEGRRVDETLQKEVKRQSLSLATIYRENESLKAEVVELRQKKKEVDAVERSAMDAQRSLKDEIRVLQEQLERARRDMDSLTQTFPSDASSSSTTTDETLRTRLSALSTLHSQATVDLAARDSRIRELHDRLTTLADSSRASIAELTRRAEEAERELRWAKEGRATAERREQLARNEAERIRLAGQGVRMPGGVGSMADQSSKVAELESLVELYKNELDQISRDSRETEERIAQGKGLVKASDLEKAREKISQLEQDIVSLESTISELTSANTRLDGEVNDLMRRVASGEYNPATERCIELRKNPATKIMAVRQQTLEDLKAENDELLERMKELDESLHEAQAGGQAAQGANGSKEGRVPRSSFDRLKKEKEDLEKAHEKRLLRLKEIFTNKSKEFLEAVYSLLGWRIKFDESGSDIRLTSMYAPKGKSGLTLKFASQEGHFGTMQMSGMMSRGLEESRHFWIVERQSVPGFLAQVTTEMFEKTTVSALTGPSFL
ncbi:mitotic spindle assembly checkpoint protein MAD1 [Kwoniella heveanensis CBS 569]|nr:mitotic spindle assembly checkpoint protein MAD1 [Kwoniella heveanensis CBS 569]